MFGATEQRWRGVVIAARSTSFVCGSRTKIPLKR